MFCVDMAPCWRGPYYMYMHAWGTNILARGMVRFLAVGTVFESATGMFL